MNCRQLPSLALKNQIADMDLFLSSDVLSQIGEEKRKESDDDYGETALLMFHSWHFVILNGLKEIKPVLFNIKGPITFDG